jgi:hypothetical protein
MGGHYTTASSDNAVYPEEFIHPSAVPCAHEITHKEEDVSKRKYTYFPLADKDGYHSVFVTKTFNTICDGCLSIIGDAFTESEQLDDARHNFVNSICTDCHYENVCKHEGDKRIETITNESYEKIEDGSAHIHTTTVTEMVYCVSCESCIDSKVISEESVTEQHIAGESCDLCGYEPVCSHKNIAISTIEQDGIIKNDGNSASHKVETWEITIRKCLDCGLEVSRGSKVINTRREAHSFSRTYNSYGAVNTCSVCNYSKLSTQNEVWTDMNAFLQESAMDEITRWVMNQSGILTVSESSMKLPAVVGNPYEAIKKAVQQGITKDYYTSMMKTILLDMLKEEHTKYSDDLKKFDILKKYRMPDSVDAVFSSDIWNNEILPWFLQPVDQFNELSPSEAARDLLQNYVIGAQIFYEAYDKFDKLLGEATTVLGEAKTVASIMDDYSEWASLMDNYMFNMQFLCSIGVTASPNSELYKACLELQSEMLNEMGGFAEFCTLTLDELSEHLTKDIMKDLMKKLEKQNLPLLSLLSRSDKILKSFPNYYSDLHKLVDAKEDILDLYVLRVDVSGELHRAVANNSNATEEIMAIYSNIVDMEFDAVETYLQEQAKQQAGFLGDIGRFFGHGDNYTANEWLGSLHQDRELFTDVYRNAWTKAK